MVINSDYPENSPYFDKTNKKVIGKFKDSSKMISNSYNGKLHYCIYFSTVLQYEQNMKLEKCRSYRQRQQENSLLTGRGGVYVDDSNVYINIAVNGFVKKQDP